MKKLLILVVFVALAFGVGKSYWRQEGAAPRALQTAKVERGDLVVTISATGTVEPEEVIDVGAQVAGLILAFGKDANGNPVDYCSPIEEGTVLARIDDALYTSEVVQAKAQVLSAQGGLKRAEADLKQAQAQLILAERNWERAQQLGSSTALAMSDYDNYKAIYDSANANMLICEAAITQAQGNLDQAKGMLERAERNLGYTTITSPVKGVIIDRRVNIGQTVVASLNAPSLFLIAKDLTRIQVWVAVNEADVGRLHPGQRVTFTVDALPGETFTGEVGKIRLNASMTQNVVTYTVEVVADNPGGRLLPYLTASVQFELSRYENVLMVPNAALRWTPTLEQVDPAVRQTLQVRADDAEAQGSDDAPATTYRSGAPPGGLPQGWTPPAGMPPDGIPPGGMPRDRARLGETRSNEMSGEQGILWTPSGQFVRPLFVRVGPTDDVMTQVQGEGLSENLPVVTGETESGSAASPSAGATNPFLPKPPRGRRSGPPPM